MRSTGRDLFVQFVSDASERRSGFHAVYSFEFPNGTIDAGPKVDEEDKIDPLETEFQPVAGENDANPKGDPTVNKRIQPGVVFLSLDAQLVEYLTYDSTHLNQGD